MINYELNENTYQKNYICSQHISESLVKLCYTSNEVNLHVIVVISTTIIFRVYTIEIFAAGKNEVDAIL